MCDDYKTAFHLRNDHIPCPKGAVKKFSKNISENFLTNVI